MSFTGLERMSALVRYVGIDVSRRMLAHAKRRLGATGNDHVLVQADACRLPFAATTFDIVYARALLHHLPEPALGLREIDRVLQARGVALVWDPNKTLVSTLPRYLARRTEHSTLTTRTSAPRKSSAWSAKRCTSTKRASLATLPTRCLGFPFSPRLVG